MGDQQNQIIKGNPSQYVKLNIGGELCEKSTHSNSFLDWEKKGREEKRGEKILGKIPMQNFHFLGFLYYTTIRTLTKVDCMLRAMFSGKLEVLTGELSEIFVRFDDWHLTLDFVAHDDVPYAQMLKAGS